MSPYETLLQQWGELAGIPIRIGNKQICCVHFPTEDVSLHIDLERSGEKICISVVLGSVGPGPYRNQLFQAALKVNGTCLSPIGILAYSDKLGSLLLYEFMPIATASKESLNMRICCLRMHAKLWIEAIKAGNVPALTEETQSKPVSLFDLHKS